MVEYGDYLGLSKSLIDQVLNQVEHVKRHALEKSASLAFDPSSLCYVEQGEVSLVFKKSKIATFVTQDVFGPWLFSEELAGSLIVASETGARIVECSFSDVELLLTNNPTAERMWRDFLFASTKRWFKTCAELKALTVSPVPVYRYYAQGDVIMQEGERGEDVLILDKGLATASVEGTFVGEIQAGEIFGALSVMSNSARATTVIAKEPCECTAFSQEDFRALLRVHPELLQKFISDVARVLRDVNSAVSRTSSSKWRSLF